MACRRKSCQKSTDEVRKFYSRSRQQQLPLTLRIPLLELLERFPNKFGVGFYPVVLNESREHSHSRLLEESGFQHGKHQTSALNWMGSYPRPMHALAPAENGIKVSLFHSFMNLSGLKVCGSSQYRAACSALCKLPEQGRWTRWLLRL
jgi:hypothetical protein